MLTSYRGGSMVRKDKTFTNKASQIKSLKEKWATLDTQEKENQWQGIRWKIIEKQVNKIQSRITKATGFGNLRLPANVKVGETNCLSGVR
jgi:hypothetical protein